MALEFEEILPFVEGEGDTGKTTREKIKRNFNKLKPLGNLPGEVQQLRQDVSDDLEQLHDDVEEMVDKTTSLFGYYNCSTAGATAAKSVQVTNYELTTGGNIRIKMEHTNTAASGVTLQIGSAAAQTLYYNGAEVSDENSWEDNEVLVVYYDGTKYIATNSLGGGGNSALAEELDRQINGTTTDYTDNWNGSNGLYTLSVGTTIPTTDGVPNKSSSSASWRCYYIPVTAGYQYVLTGQSRTNISVYTLYGLTDVNFTVLSVAESDTADELTITPEVDGYLFVNGTASSTKKLTENTSGLSTHLEKLETDVLRTTNLVQTLRQTVDTLHDSINDSQEDLTGFWDASNGYYSIPAVGQIVNNTNNQPVKNNESISWRCYYISVKDGDEFILSGYSSNSTKLYAFTDTEFKVLSRSEENTATELHITATADGFLIVNNTAGTERELIFLKKGLENRITELANDISTKAGIDELSELAFNKSSEIKMKNNYYLVNKNIGSVLNTTEQGSSSWSYALVQVKYGDIFIVSNLKSGSTTSDVRAWAWCDENYIIQQCAEPSVTYSGTLVAQQNGYLVVHSSANSGTIQKKSEAEILASTVQSNSNDIATIKKKIGFEQNYVVDNYNLSQIEFGSNDMIWTWWFYPQAITLSDRKRPLLFGYADSKLKTGIAVYKGDVVEKHPLKYFKFNTYDDHSTCALIEMQDHRIMTVSDGNHGRRDYLHVRISKKPYSIDEFGDDIPIKAAVTDKDGCSYAQIIYMNGAYYIFYREHYVPSYWSYVYSTDDGITWSAPMRVVLCTDMQYYCLFRPVKDEQNLIRILMYSNPTMGDTNIRQGFIDVSTGTIYNSDGIGELGTAGAGVEHNNFTILIPLPSGSGDYRLLDTIESEKDDPCVAYCWYPSKEATADYYIYKNGESTKLCEDDFPFYKTSSYRGGISFVTSAQAVVSRYSSEDDCDHIELYNTNDGSLVKTLNVYKTKGKTFREIRPIADKDGLFVITQQGFYDNTTYQNFYMRAKVYDLCDDNMEQANTGQ